jgi:hypothetical protein
MRPSFKTQVEQLTHEYESLLRDNPEFAAGYAATGTCSGRWACGSRRSRSFMKANELDPDIPLVKNELGNYLAEEGKPLEAISYFQVRDQARAGRAALPIPAGNAALRGPGRFPESGEWTRASVDHAMQEAFRAAAELAPDRIEFSYRYAESFYDMKEPDWTAALKAWQGLEAHAQSENRAPDDAPARGQRPHKHGEHGAQARRCSAR